MSDTSYRTVPEETTRMPSGVPYIIGNELSERFSYYGMKTILVVFMTQHLRDAHGALAPMTPDEAKSSYHLFVAGAYLFPLLGALLADIFLGKYKTIIALSLVYCAGHLALSLDETRLGLGIGLALIALGAGGIKPCVSAHVGDQFGTQNQHLLERVFNFFYFSINLGAFVSTLLTPVLLERYGSRIAFGVPGALMGVATLLFYMGRYRFAHVPPGGAEFIRELTSETGRRVLAQVTGLILFISVFWSLYEQTGSAWVLQATRMDLTVLGTPILPSQVQAINPILVLIFIPLFTYVVYPGLSRVFLLTPLRKIGIGFFLTVLAFLVSAAIEAQLDAGVRVNVAWQGLAYAVLTAAEVFVYGTGLEFFYTQAPNRMKSLVMALFLFSVSLGNFFTSFVNTMIQNADGTSKLPGATYYLFFAGLMLASSIAYVFYARSYKPHRFVQGHGDTPQTV